MLNPQTYVPCKYPQLLHYFVRFGTSFVEENADKEVYEGFRIFMMKLGIEVEDVREGAPYLCFTDNTTYWYDKPNRYWVKSLAGVGYRSEGKELKTVEDLEKFMNLVESK